MRHFALLVVLVCAASFASASQKPRPQTETMLQKMHETELKMKKLAAGHDKTMAQMKQIEAQMDSLLKAIRAFRLKLESK